MSNSSRSCLLGCLLLVAPALAGCGDAGPADTPDAQVQQEPQPDAAPSCDGVSTCTVEGVTCDGNTLVTCAADANQCLVETRAPCAEGETCNGTLSPAACEAPPAPGRDLEQLTSDVAAGICDALFRCCPGDHVEVFFTEWVNHPILQDEGYDALLPPNATLTAASCPEVLTEVLGVTPLGPWVEAARAAEVTFDPDASAACLKQLRDAECGDDVLAALYDSQCFAFAAPLGGTEQRGMFTRFKDVGEPCVGLYDGSGGGVYGTCDPTRAWCCRPSESDPNACVVRDRPTTGVCVAAGGTGAPCQFDLQAQQYCQTGLYCDYDTGTCAVPETVTLPPLQAGDACYDLGTWSDLGECQTSWCDRFGTNLCEPLKADGVACTSGLECQSGACLDECIPGFCMEGAE